MNTLKVKIWRGAESGQFQEYEVPRLESQTVLDVVTYVQRRLDPSLAYRFACRVGVCGSCAMSVNGVSRWTCRTHVDKVAKGDTLEIAPLRNLPVIRDLATDQPALVFHCENHGLVEFIEGTDALFGVVKLPGLFHLLRPVLHLGLRTQIGRAHV